MSAGSADTDDDKAWVIVETRARMAEARRLCDSVERLFRINPYLEISSWARYETNACRIALRNLSNGKTQTLDVRVSRPSEDTIVVSYANALKRATRIEIQP